MLGKDCSNALDGGNDPIGGASFTNIRDQCRHRFAPGMLVRKLQYRFISDNLGAPLGHRQIDEDSRSTSRAPFGRRLENGDGSAPDAPVLGRGRRKHETQRHPLEDQERHRELQRCKNHQQGEELAHGRVRLPTAEQEVVPPQESGGPPSGPRQDSKQRDERPVQRDIVIGVADRRRDRNDLATALGLGRRDRSRDFLPINVGKLHHHEPEAPPPPNDPPPPEKPPKPPPPLQPPPPKDPPPQPLPREPPLSAFSPQSITHGLIPPERVRYRRPNARRRCESTTKPITRNQKTTGSGFPLECCRCCCACSAAATFFCA